MSLETVTGKIDGILQVVVLVISGGLWAAAGFPRLTEVVGFGGLFIASLFIWWLTSRSHKET
jgi:type IV secretory pathway VirB2 component (pilin)